MSLFSALKASASSSFLQHRSEASTNPTGVSDSLSCLGHMAIPLLRPPADTVSLCASVATSSMYLHCFGSGSQMASTITTRAIERRRGLVLDPLSARGKLGLDLSSLRYGGTAFNVLMIKREAFLKSVQLGDLI